VSPKDSRTLKEYLQFTIHGAVTKEVARNGLSALPEAIMAQAQMAPSARCVLGAWEL
jgi:hypothetical protein